MKIDIQRFRLIEGQPFLRASFNVFIWDYHQEIRNVLYFEKGSRRWISFPSKEYEKDGEKKQRHYVVFHPPVKKIVEEVLRSKAKNFMTAAKINRMGNYG